MGSLFLKVIIPLILIGASVATVIWGKGKTEDRYGNAQTWNYRPYAAIPLLLAVGTFMFTSFTVVSGGELGVKVAPGNNVSAFTGVGYVPPFTKVVSFEKRGTVDVNICTDEAGRVFSCADSIEVAAKDGGVVYIDAEVVYALDESCPSEGNAAKGCVTEDVRSNLVGLYLSFKTDSGVKRQVRNTLRDAAKEAVNEFRAIDVLTEGNLLVQSSTEEILREELAKLGIRVIKVNFTKWRSTAEVEQAVKAKQQAEQAGEQAIIEQKEKLTRADTQRKEAEISKETKLIDAQAEADAEVILAQGEKTANLERTKGLTPEVLQSEYYTAIGQAGTVITNGETPVIIGGK
jgi:regulator of protease activity HflC (stomatin/prohibitin superfamily)